MGVVSSKKFIKNNAGVLTEEAALLTSDGAADANRIPALGSGGVLDPTIVNGTIVSSGSTSSGKVVQLDASGKIDTTTLPTPLNVYNPNVSAVELLTLQSVYSVGAAKSLIWRDATNIVGQIDTRFDGTGVNMVFGHLYNSGYQTGDLVTIKASGNVGIGTTLPGYQLTLSTDSAAKPSTNTWTVSSDSRLKQNIISADLDKCYDIVKKLPLKRYTWKTSVYDDTEIPDRSKIGWLADDVQPIFPKGVSTYIQKLKTGKTVQKKVEKTKTNTDGTITTETVFEDTFVPDTIDDCKGLNVDQIYAALYGAVQKLITKVEILEGKVR